MIMSGRNSLPCLPWRPVTGFLSFRFSNKFPGLKNRVYPEIFHCIEIFFIFQDFWGTCACPENRVCHDIFTVFYILFTFRMFEQLLLALKNRVCPEFTALNMYFYHSKFWTICACPKKQSCPDIFTVLNIFFTFRIFEQLVLAQQSVPWIHCIEYIFFIIQNFEQLALALKNIICPEIIHCIKIMLSFRIFEQLELALKTELPRNFQTGGGRPLPPRLVRHWSRLL